MPKMNDIAVSEAKRWYARLPSPDCNAAERDTFARWRMAHPDNAAAFARIEQLMGRVNELRDDADVRRAAQRALHAAPEHFGWGRWVGLAAAAVVVLAVGLGMYRFWQPPVQVQHYATSIGERRSLVLDDGSRLLLDTGTRVDVRYSWRERRIDFKSGRAQFNVAHDSRRPFVVAALGGTATALGTEFQTDRRGDAVMVTLLEGRVAVAQGEGRRQTLVPGEQLAYNARGTRWDRRRADLDAANGWIRGKLVFKDVPLAEFVAELNRYSDHKLQLADPALGERRISGTFDANDRDSLLLALREIWSIRAQPQPSGEILLSQ